MIGGDKIDNYVVAILTYSMEIYSMETHPLKHNRHDRRREIDMW